MSPQFWLCGHCFPTHLDFCLSSSPQALPWEGGALQVSGGASLGSPEGSQESQCWEGLQGQSKCRQCAFEEKLGSEAVPQRTVLCLSLHRTWALAHRTCRSRRKGTQPSCLSRVLHLTPPSGPSPVLGLTLASSMFPGSTQNALCEPSLP